MKKTIIPIALVSLTTFLGSCKKESVNQETTAIRTLSGDFILTPLSKKYLEGIEQSNIRYMPTTEDELNRAIMIDHITDIFKELYKNEEFVKLVNCAVKCGLYTDETILLKELISVKDLPNNAEFINLSKGIRTSLSDFSQAFWDAAYARRNTPLIEFLTKVITTNRQKLI